MSMPLRELDLREFGDWPLRYRAGACGLLAVLAFVLPWAVLTRPASSNWQALLAAEMELQAQLAQAQEQIDAFAPMSLSSSGPLFDARLYLPDLMTDIAEAAHRAGLHDGHFRPLQVASIDGEMPSGLPVELRLSGTWAQFQQFAADLAAPTWAATMGLRDIRLRAQASGPDPVLELSATVLAHPDMALDPLRVSDVSARNPFAERRPPRHHPRAHTVVGSLGNGQGQVGLILTEDGELRRRVK